MIRALEFYSGIGGLHLALRRSQVAASVVAAYDWDPSACKVYEENHGTGLVRRTDITRLTAADLSLHHASLWLLSPSCQPYTVLNPNAQGADDPRAQSFLHLVRSVLPELHQHHPADAPTHILVENVAGFETSTTRETLLSVLQTLRYRTEEFLLTPLQFGIPNSRLRYYLLGTLDPNLLSAKATLLPVQTHIPGVCMPWVDPRSGSRSNEPGGNGRVPGSGSEIHPLSSYLEAEEPAQINSPHGTGSSLWHPGAIPPKTLAKYGMLFDIVKPSGRRSCCFTRGYTKMAERSGSVLQMNESLDTQSTFEAFEASGDIDLLHTLKLRYFTPDELLRIFHFSPRRTHSMVASEGKSIWPLGISTKTRYKLIGNSVNVEVVRSLIDYMYQRNSVLVDVT